MIDFGAAEGSAGRGRDGGFGGGSVLEGAGFLFGVGVHDFVFGFDTRGYNGRILDIFWKELVLVNERVW